MAKKAIRKSSRARSERLEDDSMEGENFSTTRRSRGGSSAVMDRDYKDLLRDLASNPAVRYVAGGIATAVLTRIATNLSQRYPELSNFIKENLDNVEGRLGDFKNSLGDNARQH